MNSIFHTKCILEGPNSLFAPFWLFLFWIFHANIDSVEKGVKYASEWIEVHRTKMRYAIFDLQGKITGGFA